MTTDTITTATEKPPVTIYTDGACKGNPGPGGWGIHMDNGSSIRELSGGEPHTTNQRMELMAAIRALEFFPSNGRRLRVISDSRYLVKGMTEWLPVWIAKGWKSSKGKTVENLDLWERLRAAAERHDVIWAWVKGHSGNAGNEAADRLANAGASGAMKYNPN
jgi:ribonuclease HI